MIRMQSPSIGSIPMDRDAQWSGDMRVHAGLVGSMVQVAAISALW